METKYFHKKKEFTKVQERHGVEQRGGESKVGDGDYHVSRARRMLGFLEDFLHSYVVG